MVVRLTAFWAALWLALAAVPAGAQDLPIPLSYPNSGLAPRANPAKPAAVKARQEAAAAATEAACNAGDQAGCTRLALAYRLGEGRPQNRPVAELLLRDACAAKNAEACFQLGDLIYVVAWQQGNAEAGARFFALACDLGSLDGCESLASHFETSPSTAAPEVDWKEQGRILRRETCDKGGVAACRSIASAAFDSEGPPPVKAQGKADLERLCSDGDSPSCDILLNRFMKRDQYGRPVPSPYARQWLDVACRNGDDYRCLDLGMVIYAGASGPPEQRLAAIALFDRACELKGNLCEPAAAIRTRKPLAESCAAGVKADCIALGRLYADAQSPLFAPDLAIELLGRACESGAVETCDEAATLARISQADKRASLRWLKIACVAGRASECGSIGMELIGDNPAKPDNASGYDYLSLGCEGGDRGSCQKLVQYREYYPGAPFPQVDDQYLPPMPPEEREEIDSERGAAREAEERERSCTTTEVQFRGTTYSDTICESGPGVLGGYRLRPGEAPWQALLWRPEQMEGTTLDSRQRVQCGGALIRHGWVLTAAHCVVDAKKNSLVTPGHRIRLGLTNPGSAEGIAYPILRAIPHPMYHERSRAFDIALIQIDPAKGKMEETVHDIAMIRLDPQPLETRPLKDGMPVYSFGWGLTALNGEASDYLKGAKLQLEDPAACAQRNKFTGRLLAGGLLCASAPDRSQVCDGDSGGPLVNYDDADRIPTVIGVVSAGEECGTTGVPSRYTRVAKVRDWLEKTMGPRPAAVPRGQQAR